MPSGEEQLLDFVRNGEGKVTEPLSGDFGRGLVEEEPILLALMLTNRNNNEININNPNELIDPKGYTIELTRSQAEKAVLKLRDRVAQKQEHGLTAGQIRDWNENGYLMIPDALSKSQLAGMTRYVEDYVQKVFSPQEKVTVHSYQPGKESYTSPCGRAMVTLTELHAYQRQPGKLSPMQRVQRIGCGVHSQFPPFRRAVLSRRNAAIAQSLGYRDPAIVDCTILAKAAGTGREIGVHQDGGSLYTGLEMSGATFWYALEDTSVENGCLEVARGTHRVEPVRRRTVLGELGQSRYVELIEPVYANVKGVDDSTLPKKDENGEYEFTKLEAKAGTLVIMHGNLLHTSGPNRSEKNRMAMKFSIVEGEHGWKDDSFLQPGRQGGFERLQGLY